MPNSDLITKFIAALPDERRDAVSTIRKTINRNLPKGFEETMGYNMIVWSVPHSSYPTGYHCDPSKPLMLMGLSSTKGHIALHHMGLYSSGPLMDWFKAQWPRHSNKRLDMGKACIRFKRIEDVPLELIGELASKLTLPQWVENYEDALKQAASVKGKGRATAANR